MTATTPWLPPRHTGKEVKKGLSPEEQENHPARYALVEVVNIHDESLIIEPIHRALFGVDGDELLDALTDFYNGEGLQGLRCRRGSQE